MSFPNNGYTNHTRGQRNGDQRPHQRQRQHVGSVYVDPHAHTNAFFNGYIYPLQPIVFVVNEATLSTPVTPQGHFDLGTDRHVLGCREAISGRCSQNRTQCRYAHRAEICADYRMGRRCERWEAGCCRFIHEGLPDAIMQADDDTDDVQIGDGYILVPTVQARSMGIIPPIPQGPVGNVSPGISPRSPSSPTSPGYTHDPYTSHNPGYPITRGYHPN